MQRYLQVTSIQLDRSLAVLEGVAPIAEHDVGLCAIAVQNRQQLRQGGSHVQALCVETYRLSQVETFSSSCMPLFKASFPCPCNVDRLPHLSDIAIVLNCR